MKQVENFLIEIEDEAIGIILGEGNELVFHAVHPDASPLHGRVFADTVEATRAAQHVFKKAA